MTTAPGSVMIDPMETIFVEMVVASWNIFREASVYLLAGFLIAGLMRVYLSPETVNRYFRRGTVRSVINASILGIPIPI
jgi:hypothetical protein